VSLYGWQNRRARFNHDWLKNQYLLALRNFLNLLDDLIENDELERTFVAKVLPQWEERREEVRHLIADFETEMSPRTLLAQPPLVNCDRTTRQWLGAVVHSLWLAQYPVKSLVDEVAKSVDETDAVYTRLKDALGEVENTRSAEALRPLRPHFAEFYQACQSLARAIGKLPSEVKAA
jgi:hypothetical protein